MPKLKNAFFIIEKGTPFVNRETIKINKPRFLIGRESEEGRPDISFASAYISRRHVEIECRNNGYFLIDYSKHGVKINGVCISKNTPYHLKHGDKISLADDDAILTFYIGVYQSETLTKPRNEGVEIILNENKREVYINRQWIDLTGNLYTLFSLLYRNRGRAISSMEIKRAVWPERQLDHDLPMVGDEEVIMLVKRLREKLGADKELISNKRGYGYLLR